LRREGETKPVVLEKLRLAKRMNVWGYLQSVSREVREAGEGNLDAVDKSQVILQRAGFGRGETLATPTPVNSCFNNVP